jgi:hypothetical protein
VIHFACSGLIVDNFISTWTSLMVQLFSRYRTSMMLRRSYVLHHRSWKYLLLHLKLSLPQLIICAIEFPKNLLLEHGDSNSLPPLFFLVSNSFSGIEPATSTVANTVKQRGWIEYHSQGVSWYNYLNQTHPFYNYQWAWYNFSQIYKIHTLRLKLILSSVENQKFSDRRFRKD